MLLDSPTSAGPSGTGLNAGPAAAHQGLGLTLESASTPDNKLPPQAASFVSCDSGASSRQTGFAPELPSLRAAVPASEHVAAPQTPTLAGTPEAVQDTATSVQAQQAAALPAAPQQAPALPAAPGHANQPGPAPHWLGTVHRAHWPADFETPPAASLRYVLTLGAGSFGAVYLYQVRASRANCAAACRLAATVAICAIVEALHLLTWKSLGCAARALTHRVI